MTRTRRDVSVRHPVPLAACLLVLTLADKLPVAQDARWRICIVMGERTA